MNSRFRTTASASAWASSGTARRSSMSGLINMPVRYADPWTLAHGVARIDDVGRHGPRLDWGHDDIDAFHGMGTGGGHGRHGPGGRFVLRVRVRRDARPGAQR